MHLPDHHIVNLILSITFTVIGYLTREKAK